MTRIRRFIARLFRPSVVIPTYRRKQVDCSLKGETHQKLMAELGMKPESEAA